MTRKFIVHQLGEWVRNHADTQATRSEPAVNEYESLEHPAMHEFDRTQFEWMLTQGITCISMGSTVYQIRNA